MLLTVIAGAFVLSVVVLVHEFGHFIVAKWSGVFVKTFSIGFGKKILKWRPGETEYAISILPFGGYNKFAGETEYYDEKEAAGEHSEDDAELAKKTDEIPDSEIPRDRYFTTKRPAIRAAILFGGPFMNYLLAVFLYIGVTWVQGSSVYPTMTIGEVAAGSAADSVGVLPGDRVLSVDGVEVENWGDITEALYAEEETIKHLVIERDGETLEFSCRGKEQDGVYRIGIRAWVPAKVGRVKRGKPAYLAGIRSGAVIESINDTTIADWEEMRRIINSNPEVPLYIRWQLDGMAHADSITPEAVKALKPGTMNEFTVVGAIGMSPHYVQRREGLATSIAVGFTAANGMIVRIIQYLGLLFSGKMGVDTLGGPILITQMAGDVARWGFDYLLVFLAFFSINLCIFNLLPLLPFDGGHLVLLGYEAIVGRPINRRLRDIFAQAGFVLIILLMIFVVMLDLNRCTGSSPGLF
ncbi:MAG: RIP metalloprotease RseP [Candidatus Krumholzibacteria bacterium]|nr:RIP metalloprotease RseP [Candidatus Krumholzibacteria bacterium]